MKNLLAILLLSLCLNAQDFKAVKLTSLTGIIWAIEAISNDELLLNTKDGRIFSYDLNKNKLEKIKNLDFVTMVGQGGLMDLKKSPNYNSDKTVYFTYVKNYKNSYITALAKAKYENKKLSEIKELYFSSSSSDTFRHFGSRIAFDDKYLYFSIGDRGVRENGQNLKSDAGSILRFNLDASFVKDNPFKENRAIYSYGHRNPQGLYYDKNRKILFSVEHGPRGGDEINIITKASNYGWPVVSFGKEYWNPFYVGEKRSNKEGMEDAIKVYDPSIAPSSLIVYEGDKFSSLKGSILVGALKLTHINKLSLDKNNRVIKEERLFESLKQRIRDLAQTQDGRVFFSTDAGEIYEIK